MADNGRWSSWTSGSEKLAASNTLPEHYCALALLHQLDHAWFYDNLLKPRLGLRDAFLPPPHRLSPYQSVELTNSAHRKWPSSLLSQHPRSGKMPCARFESTSLVPSISGNVPPEGGQSALERDHQLHRPHQSSLALISQRNVFSNLLDTISVPSAALQACVVKDVQRLKECEVKEGMEARDVEFVEPGKQLRASMVDGQLLPEPTLRVVGRKRMWRTSSRSMTAVEFDELQGFMELGFHVSQDDLTPRMMRLFPARRNKLEEDGSSRWNSRATATKPDQISVGTWLVRGSASPLQQWQAPATREDMKEHLKFWARAVASMVRQEC